MINIRYERPTNIVAVSSNISTYINIFRRDKNIVVSCDIPRFFWVGREGKTLSSRNFFKHYWLNLGIIFLFPDMIAHIVLFSLESGFNTVINNFNVTILSK